MFADDLIIAEDAVKDTGQLAMDIRNRIDESIQFVEQTLMRLKAYVSYCSHYLPHFVQGGRGVSCPNNL